MTLQRHAQLTFIYLRYMSRFVLVMFLVLQFVCIMLAVGSVIFNHVKYNNGSYDELMGKQEETGFLLWLLRYATYLCVLTALYFYFDFYCDSVLLSVFVPISLWVTMEIVRFVQARFMQWDKQMYSTPEEGKKRKKKPKKKDDDDSSSAGAAEPELKGMIAKTSSLNEDLGRVRYRAMMNWVIHSVDLDRAHLLGQNGHFNAKHDDIPLHVHRTRRTL